MKFILLLVSLISFLYSDHYPIFTKQELDTIDVIDRNRIKNYQSFMQSCTDSSKIKKLYKVNLYLNSLLPQYDDIIQKEEDKWSTPKEFLTVGYGDCEDYAIIKYYSLIELGFDEKKLFITVVKEKYHGSMHMVLSYFRYKGVEPLILDNLSFKVLNLTQRTDLEVQYFINSTGIYKIGSNFTLHRIAAKFKKFEELQEKIKNNR